MKKRTWPNTLYYEGAVNDDIYVDKTLVIESMNKMIDTNHNRICVSRPRRFGKSTTLCMLWDYYSTICDSRALFEQCKISKKDNWDRYLNSFLVLSLDTQIALGEAEYYKKDLCKYMKESIYEDIESQYVDSIKIDRTKSLRKNLIDVYKQTNIRFIILIDEYDILIREQSSKKQINKYLKFLNSFSDNDEIKEAVALVYLTGIFPMVKGDSFIKVNEFFESSIVNPSFLAKYIGFTEDEVKELCDKNNMDFQLCKKWYDGYKIGNNESIYNSLDIHMAMLYHEFSDYWSHKGTCLVISDNLQSDINGLYNQVLNMVKYNEPIRVNIENFNNRINKLKSKDDILSYLIHIGYLAYDKETKTCCIPNDEIMHDWTSAVSRVPSLKRRFL